MITFHGKWDKAGNRYTEVDFKLLRNEKAQERLIRQFENSEHKFDFHFYKGPKSNWNTSLKGSRSPEWVKKNLDIDIEPSDDKTTVLITSNIGSPKYPLTPWIIAHRISHAIWLEIYDYYNSIDNIFTRIVGREVYYKKWFGCAIGTFRSARNRTLARTGEMYHELFAQNLLTGKVKLKHIENSVLVRKRWRNCEYRFFNNNEVDVINSTIDRLENTIYHVTQKLDEMYGSIIVV